MFRFREPEEEQGIVAIRKRKVSKWKRLLL
jgi:hypothetical protein